MSLYLNKNSKILIVGSKNNFSLDSVYFKTFRYLGYNVDFINIEKSINLRIVASIKKYFSELNYKFLRKKLILLFQKKNKKYDLIIFFKSIFLNKKTLQGIKLINKKKVICINIFPDDPFQINNPVISNKTFLKTINEFDIFFIWSQKIINKLKKKFKTKFFYLPFGFDSLLISKFKKIQKKTRVEELNFIGTYDADRLNILESIKIRKKIFGGNWFRLNGIKLRNTFIGSHIYGKKIFKLMNASAISLNILRKQNYTSHNMRTFEIPANNGLMLTTRSKEQNKFFKENRACFMFSSKSELQKKIKFILQNPRKAENVRKLGNRLAIKHSYVNRIKFLLKEINKIDG